MTGEKSWEERAALHQQGAPSYLTCPEVILRFKDVYQGTPVNNVEIGLPTVFCQVEVSGTSWGHSSEVQNSTCSKTMNMYSFIMNVKKRFGTIFDVWTNRNLSDVKSCSSWGFFQVRQFFLSWMAALRTEDVSGSWSPLRFVIYVSSVNVEISLDWC